MAVYNFKSHGPCDVAMKTPKMLMSNVFLLKIDKRFQINYTSVMS